MGAQCLCSAEGKPLHEPVQSYTVNKSKDSWLLYQQSSTHPLLPTRDPSLIFPLFIKPFGCIPSSDTLWQTSNRHPDLLQAPSHSTSILYLVTVHKPKPISVLELHILLLLLLLFLTIGIKLQPCCHREVISNAENTDFRSNLSTASNSPDTNPCSR